MKFKEIKERIKLARASNVQDLLPIDSFLEKTDSAEALLDFVEQQEADREIMQQARWYLAIMCVSGLRPITGGNSI